MLGTRNKKPKDRIIETLLKGALSGKRLQKKLKDQGHAVSIQIIYQQLNDLIDLFGSETLRLISEIKIAADEKNILKLNKSSRSLKLGADYIGAKKLSDLSHEIEKETSEGSIPRNVKTVINELEYYYCQSSEFLDKKKAA